MKEEEIIPGNETGIQSNTESSIELHDEEDAKIFFQQVKNRLLKINQWNKIAGKASADFQLTDQTGHPIDRLPQTQDHIKIDIPGPGSVTGEGDDWVQIEEIIEEKNMICIRVRPATNPLNDKNDIAHFFSAEATSSFVIQQKGKKITAAVFGRNEKPNTGTEKLIDKIRNTAVATGAISGFSKLQWKGLVDGLVERGRS